MGDALDNALMESTIGLFKTEVIDHEQATWTSWREVENATASWVHWFNNERRHSSIGDIPPTEYEQTMTIQHTATTNPPRPNKALHQSQAGSDFSICWGSEMIENHGT